MRCYSSIFIGFFNEFEFIFKKLSSNTLYNFPFNRSQQIFDVFSRPRDPRIGPLEMVFNYLVANCSTFNIKNSFTFSTSQVGIFN